MTCKYLVHGAGLLLVARGPAEVEDGLEGRGLPDQVALVDAVHTMGGHVLDIPGMVSRERG